MAAEGEAELGQHDLDRVGVLGLDLDEVEAGRLVERHQRGQSGLGAVQQVGRLVLQERQRAEGVHRRPGTSVCRKMSLNTSSDSGPA